MGGSDIYTYEPVQHYSNCNCLKSSEHDGELIVLADTEGKLGNLLYLQVKLHSLNTVLPFCEATKCLDESLTSSTTTELMMLCCTHMMSSLHEPFALDIWRIMKRGWVIIVSLQYIWINLNIIAYKINTVFCFDTSKLLYLLLYFIFLTDRLKLCDYKKKKNFYILCRKDMPFSLLLCLWYLSIVLIISNLLDIIIVYI